MKTQQQFFYESHQKLAECDIQFMEIMKSNNPLTKEDFEKLVKKRPEFWKRYEKFFMENN